MIPKYRSIRYALQQSIHELASYVFLLLQSLGAILYNGADTCYFHTYAHNASAHRAGNPFSRCLHIDSTTSPLNNFYVICKLDTEPVLFIVKQSNVNCSPFNKT